MTLPRTLAACAACLAAGYALRWATAPARLEHVLTTDAREEVRYSRRVEVVTLRATDVRTVTRTQWLPSGEVTQVVELVDRSRDTLVAREDRAQEATTSATTTEVSKPVAPPPDWRLTALVGRGVYGASVERRILGPLHLGVAATTRRDVFVTIGVTF